MEIMKISKSMINSEIAELLRAAAAAYQVKGKQESKFKIVAYQRAADAVEHLSSEVKDLWDEGKLDEIPGVGKSIASHLDEIFKTGKSKHFDRLMGSLPSGMFELLEVPGIGPKTAYRLSKKFKLESKNSISELKKIVQEGKVSKLEGFGEDSQRDLLLNIEEFERKPEKRILLSRASNIAEEVIEWMRREKAVEKVDPLGSLRRRASTIGDIDMSVSSNNPAKVIDHFIKFPKKLRVVEKGERTASILLSGGVQVDLMIQSPESYGSLLQHFTGSKHHNIALREYALKKGLSLSEYGIKDKKLKKFKTEKEFYNYLGLKYIPPELREDAGEIEAALEKRIPRLVELGDIKGDLQIHSSYDIETSHDLGESSMEELVTKANELNYEYVAFTEHNPSRSGHSQKQIVEILKRKREKVEKLNYSLRNIKENRVRKVFNSLEIDILPDGSLPLGEEALATLDFALISVHSGFRIKRSEMTKRIISAFSHPKSLIFAHPTARKLNNREGIELDWDTIFDFCINNKKWIEINADPMRLDLPDFLVHEAVKLGVKLTLGTDSHHKDGMDNMEFGVSVARRGWATRNDIINSRTVSEFTKLIDSDR